MAKVKLDPRPFIYPKPAVLVGALVDGKPNFMTIANAGIAGYDPPVIGVSSYKSHYTNLGIKKHRAFSVNIPSTALAQRVDFCGLYSGRKVDKSKLFDVFFGEIGKAPLIADCPVCLECKLIKTITLHDEYYFLGQIMAIYADKNSISKGIPDIRKVDPIIYSTSDKTYYSLGKKVGKAYEMGKVKRSKG